MLRNFKYSAALIAHFPVFECVLFECVQSYLCLPGDQSEEDQGLSY